MDRILAMALSFQLTRSGDVRYKNTRARRGRPVATAARFDALD